MKIIHCADLHLESSLLSHLPKEKAAERRRELLHSFLKMVEYADQNQVSAFLIAGDFFDGAQISTLTFQIIQEAILSHPNISFYYLRGNHDAEDVFMKRMKVIPKNWHFFDSDWKTYQAGENIFIHGLEIGPKTDIGDYDYLQTEKPGFHIVLLHGQVTESNVLSSPEAIPLKKLRNRGIDYLALGHYHSYQKQQLDSRGIYCYAGSPESRGFDECGVHGFVLLEIENGRMTHQFIQIEGRRFFEKELNISDCATTPEVFAEIETLLQSETIRSQDALKLILLGQRRDRTDIHLAWLTERLSEKVYFCKIIDRTCFYISPDEYQKDAGLKGEFVRLVQSDSNLSAMEKSRILENGLRALRGEGIG